jgi:putative selenium metabolism hydrolase
MRSVASVNQDALIDFTKRLIQTPSPSGEERAISKLVAEEMDEVGFDQVRVDDQFNVLGTFGESSPGRDLLLLAHIDHAEIGGMEDPFSGKEIDGATLGQEGRVIYGRGACDMKGALASMVYAVEALVRSNLRRSGRTTVLAFTREEWGTGEGLEYAVEKWDIRADMAVSGEATNLDVYIGHRGSMQFKVTTRGRTSHASNPARGINAIDQMNQFLNTLHASYRMPSHPFMGVATFAVLDIRAEPGARTAVVPDLCEIIVDRRYFPGEDQETLETEFRDLIRLARRTNPELEATVELHKDSRPMLCEPDLPIVQILQRSRHAVLGKPSELGAWKFGIDVFAVEDRGIPCVGLGPGNEIFAHTPQDHVRIDDLVAASEIYARAVMEASSYS